MIVCETILQNWDVIILANVIFGPKRTIRSIALKALLTKTKRRCINLNFVHEMIICFNTYHGFPKLPIRESFKHFKQLHNLKSYLNHDCQGGEVLILCN